MNREDCHFLVVGDGFDYSKIKNWYDATNPKSETVMQSLPKVDYELPAQKFDACVAAVAHKKFEGQDVCGLLKEKHVVFDVKCTLDRACVDGRL